MKFLFSLTICLFFLAQLAFGQGFRRDASIDRHSVGLGLELDGYTDSGGFLKEASLGFGISANYDYKFSDLIKGVFQVGYVKFGDAGDYYESDKKSEMVSVLVGAKFRLFQNFYTIGQIGVGYKTVDYQETEMDYYYSSNWTYYNYYTYRTPKTDKTTVKLGVFGFGYKFQLSTKLELDASAKYYTALGPKVPANSLNLRIATVFNF